MNLHLQDCQGGRLAVHGARKASLIVTDRDGTEAELEHKFAIGDVKNLYPQSW